MISARIWPSPGLRMSLAGRRRADFPGSSGASRCGKSSRHSGPGRSNHGAICDFPITHPPGSPNRPVTTFSASMKRFAGVEHARQAPTAHNRRPSALAKRLVMSAMVAAARPAPRRLFEGKIDHRRAQRLQPSTRASRLTSSTQSRRKISPSIAPRSQASVSGRIGTCS